MEIEEEIIDLNGTQGNAYYILAVARRYSKKLGKDFDKIQSEMTSGDYENLLKVFEREFGDYVFLIR